MFLIVGLLKTTFGLKGMYSGDIPVLVLLAALLLLIGRSMLQRAGGRTLNPRLLQLSR